MGLAPFTSDPDAFPAPRPYLLYSGRREPLKGTPLLLDYVNAFRRRTGATRTGQGEADNLGSVCNGEGSLRKMERGTG